MSSPKRPRKKLKREPQDLVLLANQTEHVDRLRTILNKYPFALDLSMLGAGKTYTSSYLAKHGLEKPYKHVVVVCPVSVLPKWRTMSETYGISILSLGYQALRSSKHRQPKHGLLHRRDVIQGVLTTTSFSSTEAYISMVNEGTLLIFDEVQNIKNISSQFLAAQALIHEITRRPGSGLVPFSSPTLFQRAIGVEIEKEEPCASRVLLLSGSPIDQKEHATHIFRALGIMVHDRVSQMNIHTHRNEWRGMQEIFDFCEKASPQTQYIPSQALSGEPKLDPYIYRLFQGVLKPACSSAMHPPPPSTTLRKINAFYDVDTEGAEIISRGLNSLKRAARFDGANVNFRGNGEQMAGVTRAMQVIETGKIQLFARIAREVLASPVAKVVIAVNYSDTIADLKELLQEYKPLLLVGSTTEAGRKTVLDQFQAPSTDSRLMLCNQSVASTGIDLDDKDGGFPRTCLVSPNYSTITSYQLGHRFQRLDTKSDANVHFVFAKRHGETREASEDIIELKVLHALSRKSQIMKETTGECGIVYPGDHPEWLESGTSSGPVTERKLSRLGIIMRNFFDTKSPMRQVYFADNFTRYSQRYALPNAIKFALRDSRTYFHFVGPITQLQANVRDSVRSCVLAM